jgi:hypothetical protein
MNGETFSAEKWIETLNRGEFDGHVSEEVLKLSSQELEKVAILLARLKGEKCRRSKHNVVSPIE